MSPEILLKQKYRENRKKKSDKARALSLLDRLKIRGLPVVIYRDEIQIDIRTEKANNVPMVSAVQTGDLQKDGSWYKRMNRGQERRSALYEFRQRENIVTLKHLKRERFTYKFVFVNNKYANEYLKLLINNRKVT